MDSHGPLIGVSRWRLQRAASYTAGMSPSRRLLRYVLKYRRAFAIGFACVIVTAAVGLAGPWVLKYAIDDLGQGVDSGKVGFYASAILGARRGRRVLSLRDAPDHHRRVARHRVRPAQRLLRASAAARPRVLPAASHRRPDVARDQRPERGADDDRSGDHVLGDHRPDVHRRHHPDGVDQPAADAVRAGAAAVRLDLRRATSAPSFTGGSSASRSSCRRSARSRRRRCPACASSVPIARSRSRSSGSGWPTRSTSAAIAG